MDMWEGDVPWGQLALTALKVKRGLERALITTQTRWIDGNKMA